MQTRVQSRATKAQAENENQPQLGTTAEIAELRQVVQQQAELMQKQAEEARRREEELTCCQNELFEAFIQRLSVTSGENRAGPAVEQVGPEVSVQPPQPRQEPRALTPGLKLASERFMKKNPLVFQGTVELAVDEEWISMIEKICEFIYIKDEDKVKCARYMLRNDAKIWWDAVKKTQDVAVMTWIEFLI